MKQVEVVPGMELDKVLQEAKEGDVILTREAHAVALLREFDDDDLECYEHEHDPAFIESLKRARLQAAKGQVISLDELKKELGINEPFSVFLRKEVERILGGEEPWVRLKEECLKLLGKEDRGLFESQFSPEKCELRYEKVPRSALNGFIPGEGAGRAQQQPNRADEEPLIIVEFLKRKILVEGKRRLADKAKGLFPAIIIGCQSRNPD